MDDATEQGRVFDGRLRDVAEQHAAEPLFLPYDVCDKRGMGRECFVCFWMPAHVVDFYGLGGSKWRTGVLYLSDDAFAGVVKDPVGEIMQARGIAVDDAVAIAQRLQLAAEVGIRERLLAMTDGECEYILNERGAIQLAGVDDELLCVVDFEGMCHVGAVEKESGEVEDVRGGIGES